MSIRAPESSVNARVLERAFEPSQIPVGERHVLSVGPGPRSPAAIISSRVVPHAPSLWAGDDEPVPKRASLMADRKGAIDGSPILRVERLAEAILVLALGADEALGREVPGARVRKG